MTLAMQMPKTFVCALSLGGVLLFAAPAGADDTLPPPVIRRSSKARPVAPRPAAPRPAAPAPARTSATRGGPAPTRVPPPAPAPVRGPVAPPPVHKLPPIHPPAIPLPASPRQAEVRFAPPPKLDPDPAPPPPPPEPWQQTRAARSVDDPNWASDIGGVARGESQPAPAGPARVAPPQPAPSDDRVPPPAYDGGSTGADGRLDIPPIPEASTPAAPRPPWSEPIDASAATPVPPPAPVRRGAPIVATPLPAPPPAPAQPEWSRAVDPQAAKARRAQEERLQVPAVRYVPPADPDWASDITDSKPRDWQRRVDPPAPVAAPPPPIRDSGSPALPPPAWSKGEVRWTAPQPTPKAPAQTTTPVRRGTAPPPPPPAPVEAPVAPPGGWSAPAQGTPVAPPNPPPPPRDR